MKCNYCDRQAERVTGNTIYPHRPDLFSKVFYRCEPCDAYVGCHPRTSTPLGHLANRETRRLRQKAHAAFDPIWKSGRMSRKDAYGLLSRALGISDANCHIGHFDLDMCRKVLDVVRSLPQKDPAE